MARSRRPHTLTTRGRAMFACGVVLLLAGILLGFRDITRIGVLLLLLPIVARLVARSRSPRLAVDRAITPTNVQAGESAEVSVEFTNVGERSTTLYSAEEQVSPALGESPRFLLPRLRPQHRRRITYSVTCQRRGRHHLGPVALRQEDPFGLTRIELTVRSLGEIVVRPHVEPLGQGQPAGAGFGIEGETPQMMALHGEDDVSIRNYRDGDDLRKVHWPATAHRGELMVRQEDRPARRSAVLLLDSRASGHSPGDYSASFEWAVSALASVAVRLSGMGYVLHLATRESLEAGRLDVDLGSEEVLDELARVEPGSDSDHERLMHAVQELAERTGGIVAATTGAGGMGMTDLATLRRPGTTAQALIVDRDSFIAGSADVGPSTLAHQTVLHQAGWRAIPITAHTEIAHAWAVLTATGRAIVRS
ncbi:DUF58 domain-containing protein [Demetria terragena]|uniref:DUF58 domain-containing protein n=1 Tax=Demetria terragena TaxID=63959 RepID=UPI00058F9384|nr:DUF58 domain-containing protein [Demetria terragena]